MTKLWPKYRNSLVALGSELWGNSQSAHASGSVAQSLAFAGNSAPSRATPLYKGGGVRGEAVQILATTESGSRSSSVPPWITCHNECTQTPTDTTTTLGPDNLSSTTTNSSSAVLPTRYPVAGCSVSLDRLTPQQPPLTRLPSQQPPVDRLTPQQPHLDRLSRQQPPLDKVPIQ